jgi:hypothetical protein
MEARLEQAKFDKIEAKSILVGFMAEHFGSQTANKLLGLKLLQYHVEDIIDLNEYEFKRFINSIYDSLFNNIMTKDRAKMSKLLLIKKIFGRANAFRIISEEMGKKATNPILFLNEFYGPAIGSLLLEEAMKKHGQPDISRADDLEQILFLKKINADFFGDSRELLDNMNLELLLYLKKGAVRMSLFEALLQDLQKGKRKEAIFSFLNKMTQFMKDVSKERMTQVAEGLMQQVTDISFLEESEVLDICGFLSRFTAGPEDPIDKPTDSDSGEAFKGTQYTGDFHDVLNAYFKEPEAEKIISDTLKKLKLPDIPYDNNENLRRFADEILNHSKMKSQSTQRISMIMAAIRNSLGV